MRHILNPARNFVLARSRSRLISLFRIPPLASSKSIRRSSRPRSRLRSIISRPRNNPDSRSLLLQLLLSTYLEFWMVKLKSVLVLLISARARGKYLSRSTGFQSHCVLWRSSENSLRSIVPRPRCTSCEFLVFSSWSCSNFPCRLLSMDQIRRIILSRSWRKYSHLFPSSFRTNSKLRILFQVDCLWSICTWTRCSCVCRIRS